MRPSSLFLTMFLTLACDADRSRHAGAEADATIEADLGTSDGSAAVAPCRLPTRAWLSGGTGEFSHTIHRQAQTRNHVIDLMVGASSIASCKEE